MLAAAVAPRKGPRMAVLPRAIRRPQLHHVDLHGRGLRVDVHLHSQNRSSGALGTHEEGEDSGEENDVLGRHRPRVLVSRYRRPVSVARRLFRRSQSLRVRMACRLHHPHQFGHQPVALHHFHADGARQIEELVACQMQDSDSMSRFRASSWFTPFFILLYEV